MMNLIQTLMIAALAVTMIAVLQIAASAMPTTTGTLSMTADQPNIVMASDRGHRGGGWHGGGGRVGWGGHDGRWYGRGGGWYAPRGGWYDPGYYPYYDHDNDALGLLLGGALLGALLTR